MPRPQSVIANRPDLIGRARPQLVPTSLNVNDSNSSVSLLGPVSQYVGQSLLSYATETTVLGLPAAWRCLNLISNAVGMMMARGNAFVDELKVEPTPTIISRPNVLYGATAFWTEVVATAILHGNYVAVITGIERNEKGKPVPDEEGNDIPTQVTPVHPSQVSLDMSSGLPVYKIGDRTYGFSQVVHVRGYTIPGSWWGVGVLDAHSRELGLAFDQQTYARTSYSSSGAPSVVVTLDTDKMPEQGIVDSIKTQFSNTYKNGNREAIVAPKTMKIESFAWSPEQMEFLSSRQFSIAEIAMIFNLDPTDLSASIGGQGMTYANVAQRELSRTIHTYGFWLNRLEDAWTDLLPGNQKMRGNPASLLRSDTKTRYETMALADFMSTNEKRELEHLAPLPDTENATARNWAVVGLPTLVAGGLMTVNEARGQLGLAPIEGADELIVEQVEEVAP